MSNKLFKNVVKYTAKSSRPLLQGIYFSEDGNVVATNSHIAIILKEYNKTNTSFILNPNTLEQLEGNYPNVINLILEDIQYSLTLTLSLDLMSALLNTVKPYKKEICKFSFKENNLTVSIKDSKSSFIIPFNYSSDFTIHFKVEYLIIVLQTFIDEKLPVKLQIKTPVSPVLFNTDKVKVILSPVRIS